MANAGPVKSEEQRIVDNLLNEDSVGTALLKYVSTLDLTKIDFHTRSGQYGASVISRIITSFNNTFDKIAIELLLKLPNLPNIDWNDQYPIQGTPFDALASLAIAYTAKDLRIDPITSKKGYEALLMVLRIHGEKINLNLNFYRTTPLYMLVLMLKHGFSEPIEIVLKNTNFKHLDFTIKSSAHAPNIMQIIFCECSLKNKKAINLLQYIPTDDATLWNDSMIGGEDDGMTTLLLLVNLIFITPAAWSLLKKVALLPGINWDAEVMAGKAEGKTPMSELLRGVAMGDPRAIAIRDFIAEKIKEEMRMEWVRNYAQASQYVPGYQGGLRAAALEIKEASMEPSAAARP